MVLLDNSWEAELVAILRSPRFRKVLVEFIKNDQELLVEAKAMPFNRRFGRKVVDKRQVSRVTLTYKMNHSMVGSSVPVKKGENNETDS